MGHPVPDLKWLGRFFPAFFETFYNFSYLYFSSLTFLSAGGEYLEQDPLRANKAAVRAVKGDAIYAIR